MKAVMTVLGLTAACAACCAFPALASALAAIGATSLGTALGGWIIGSSVLILLGAGLALVAYRGAAAARRCGCGPAVADPTRTV